MSTSRLWPLGLLVLAAATCASDDDIAEEFRAYVAGANSCTTVAECAIASTDCPLGCSHAVRADRKADVEKKGKELVERYQRWGARCDYECVPPGALVCVANRCALTRDVP